jgi:electron transfer flavoprotein alpha subunit
MAKILLFLESSEGDLKKSSLELLSLLQGSQHDVAALSTTKLPAEAQQTVASYGVKSLFHGDLGTYHPDTFATALVETIDKVQAEWVLGTTSSLAKDVMPKVAARKDAAYVSDVTEIQPDGAGFSLRRPMYSGKCSAAVKISGDGLKVVLMRPNQLPVSPGQAGASLQTTELTAAAPNSSLKLKNVVQGDTKRADLTEADVIISGGRGLKEAKNFELLEQVADLLGATVGASRAVVDAGWVDHSMQVGQTGKTVAPSLYIACGISGAVQHLAGMSSSKVIVAINNDANAPIFQKATYGVVGDALEILPLLRDELKSVL